MAEGGFSLREWKTNSRGLQKEIAKSESVTKSMGAQNVNRSDDEMYAKSSLIDCYRSLFAILCHPMDMQLHGFGYASERAHAAVVYVRSTHRDGRTEVRLVASKSKVAPIKWQTIPRLELLGTMERQDCLMSICFIICSAVPIICSAFL